MATDAIVAALTPVKDHVAAGTALLKKALSSAGAKKPDSSSKRFLADNIPAWQETQKVVDL